MFLNRPTGQHAHACAKLLAAVKQVENVRLECCGFALVHTTSRPDETTCPRCHRLSDFYRLSNFVERKRFKSLRSQAADHVDNARRTPISGSSRIFHNGSRNRIHLVPLLRAAMISSKASEAESQSRTALSFDNQPRSRGSQNGFIPRDAIRRQLHDVRELQGFIQKPRFTRC